MFKNDGSRAVSDAEADKIARALLPLSTAIRRGDVENVGRVATLIRLSALNLEVVAQIEHEGWKAVERKRRKVSEATKSLAVFLRQIGYLGEKEDPEKNKDIVNAVGMMLKAATEEYPVDATVIPPHVWAIYKRVAKKEGKKLDRNFKEGQVSVGTSMEVKQ